MKNKKELVIGIVVVIALASLVLGVQFLKGINAFNSNRTFYSHYDNVQSLVPGSIINFRGKQVGVVADVRFNENQTEVITEFNISESGLKIPSDSRAKLSSDMLGTTSIELVLGENYSSLLEKNDTITPDFVKGFSESISEKMNPIVFKTEKLLESLNSSLVKVDTALGVDGKNVTSLMQNLKYSLNTLNSTLKTTDNLIKSSTTDINTILKNVASITGNLKNSNEKVTNLVSNFSDISDSLKNADIAGTINSAKDALEGVAQIVNEINDGDGSIHQLIYNKELINNINAMIKETENLVKNIEDHPNRYLHFAVFGRKDKGLKFNKSEEKKLKKILKDTPE